MNWIAQLFQDYSFSIIPNQGGGDCLFHVLSQATGIKMEDLKYIVAADATQEEFNVKKSMYESATKEYTKTGNRDYLIDILNYKWLENVTNLYQYQKLLATHGTWGDGESVDHLERILNCRILLLSRESSQIVYNTASPVKRPKYYVLVNYIDSTHFELISFKGFRCFTRADLPFVIKIICKLR